MARELQTAENVEQVIKAIGGPAALADVTGRSVQAVSNWKSANRLPARSYLVLSKKLEEAGWQAPPALWGIEVEAA